MITYEKLVCITGNSYTVRTDDIADLWILFQNITNINTIFVLVLKHGTDIHTIDLGRLVRSNIELLQSSDIHQLILQLTPELIYTYRIDMFNQDRYIRSFIDSDLPGDTVISPCNIETGEMSNTSYDPNYKDLLISCQNYDLTKVIPIIDNKLRFCSWYDKKIFLNDKVGLTRTTKNITFLSFGNVELQLQRLYEVSSQHWVIPDGYLPLLVLNGALYYEPSRMFMIDRDRNKLLLNEQFILDTYRSYGFDTLRKIIDDPDSFVIFIKANRIMIRDMNAVCVKDEEPISQYVYHEEYNQSYHLDYICLSNDDNTIRGITIADEQYKNVKTLKKPFERHVYVLNGNNNNRIIQMSIC